MNHDVCLNCETPLRGRWCHHCGQQQLLPEDRRMGRVLGELFGAVTNLDSRLWRTLKSAVLAPGRYTFDYLAGRRRRYISPITLFLFANLIYFFAPSVSDFSPSLLEHTRVQPYSAIADRLVSDRLAGRGIGLTEYATVFESQQANLAKTLIIIHVPLLAIGLWLLHCRRRFLIADHMLVAFQVMGILLIHFLVTAHLLHLVVAWANLGPQMLGVLLKVGLIVPIAVWLAFLLHTGYENSWPAAFLKAVAVLVVIGVAHFSYRSMLFGLVFLVT